MNIQNIEYNKDEKYVAFATDSPQTVHYKLSGLALPFLADLWWEYYDAWQDTELPQNKKIPIWVHLQVLTNLLVHRTGWDNEKKRPYRSRPEPKNEVYKTYKVGSPEWGNHWRNNPQDQRDMLEWMKQHSVSYGWVD